MSAPAQLHETFPASPESIAFARALVDGVRPALPPEQRDRARLLVSEVVTNAIRHGAGTAVQVTVERRGAVVCFAVRDDGPGFVPEPSEPDPLRGGGWGLQLVGQFADDWGVHVDHGTTVWFELTVPDILDHAPLRHAATASSIVR